MRPTPGGTVLVTSFVFVAALAFSQMQSLDPKETFAAAHFSSQEAAEVIRAVSEDRRKLISDQGFQKIIAQRGSYARAMTPAETTAFVQAQQQMWQPVLDRLPGRH